MEVAWWLPLVAGGAASELRSAPKRYDEREGQPMPRFRPADRHPPAPALRVRSDRCIIRLKRG